MANVLIIKEDADIIVAYKPAGVPTQTKKVGVKDVESVLRNYRSEKGEDPYIGIIHRLDQNVEGVMVFAKNQKAAAFLSKQVQDRKIAKHYYAVISWKNEEIITQSATITDYMTYDKRTNYASIVNRDHEDAKKAVLKYRILEHVNEKGLLDIELVTGRHHQIRLQFANLGFPLVGDVKYGPADNELDDSSIALCSYYLEFTHPRTGKTERVKIKPQGAVFQEFRKFRLS